MSQNLYDLNQFSRYVPADNKPYYMIAPQSEEEQQRLFDYVGQQAHFEGFLRELRGELKRVKFSMRIASALPIGETVKGEIVVLIIQGFVHKKEFEGESFIVVCAPPLDSASSMPTSKWRIGKSRPHSKRWFATRSSATRRDFTSPYLIGGFATGICHFSVPIKCQ